MPGVTKRISDHVIRDIISMWSQQIKTILPILPYEYGKEEIIALLKEFYPHEWQSVEYKHLYYKKKDEHIKKHTGRTRHNMPSASKLLDRVPLFQKILTDEYRLRWHTNFSLDAQELARQVLYTKRKPKIDKVDKKIAVAKAKTQQVTPDFIGKLIGLYERKNTSQKDRMYILLELKKYYNPTVINFFFKLNDTEINSQLRWSAFYHLQSFNYAPRARRQKYMLVHTKNKKRKQYLKNVYPYETYDIPETPQELEYRIDNSKEQLLKEYDYFISHSSKDSEAVQSLIVAVNQQKKNVFCDWINDVDYLKRHLVCDATLKVIERRMEQSRALIFVESENSRKSIWCKYELNYFRGLGKPIFMITKDNINAGVFDLKPMLSDWYLDSDYKKLALLEGASIQV
ncbi:MAG: toll/interleukin-1 receptor domain-containing protein [Clostridia bacterium]|nr:toll/interleukin-1 receptor domain-containing protein [Clostridia bacterium]